MSDIDSILTREDMTFEEAADYFKDRVPVTAAQFYKIADDYRSLAFTVSGYTKAQILKKFYDELLAAIEQGNSIGEFRANMNDFLESEGYEGLSDFQADNIFRTNIQTAYSVGHYDQLTQPEILESLPYWEYDAVDDSHTRPSHLAMNGKVFPADSPVWDVWYPPNGFRCRCTVRALSKRQVEQRNLKIETEIPRAAELSGRYINILPDPQFTTNPAKVRFNPDLEGYPEPLVRAYQKREQEGKKAQTKKEP
jgi:SPP1 gp7 family putative phage head morphogenesis protein